MKAIFFISAIAITSVYCRGNLLTPPLETLFPWDTMSETVKLKFNITIIGNYYDSLMNKTKERCPNIMDQIATTFPQAVTCVVATDSSSETFCSRITNNFVKCTEPLQRTVDDCLPDESKGLGRMMIKLMVAVLNKTCKSTLEELIELYNPCQMEKKFTTFEPCSQIKDALVENQNKPLSKGLVCNLLPELKECMKYHVEASCPNPVTKYAIMQHFEVVEMSTEEECQDINNT